VLDEYRYALLPVIRGIWGERGVRVHAPYATKYKWGYLHEAMEVDGRNAAEPLFTPAIDQDTHALFLRRIAESAPEALHAVIQDRAGFNLPVDDSRLPPKLRVCNRLYPTITHFWSAISRPSSRAACGPPVLINAYLRH
jgi:hypothetical protein